MIDEYDCELVHADLDGELPETARAELSRRLLASPEARAYARDMQQVCIALDSLPRVDAPPGLREAIVNRIALADAAGPLPAPRRAAWMPGTALRYAAAFAGGIVVSALAFQFAGEPRGELATSDLVGTIAHGERAVPATPLDSVTLELEQFRGEAALYDARSTLLLEVELAADQPVDVVVRYGGAQTRLSRAADPMEQGRQRYALALGRNDRAGSSVVTLQFFVAGVLVHEQGLETGRDR